MFTGGTIWIMTHGEVSVRSAHTPGRAARTPATPGIPTVTLRGQALGWGFLVGIWGGGLGPRVFPRKWVGVFVGGMKASLDTEQKMLGPFESGPKVSVGLAMAFLESDPDGLEAQR